MDKLIITVAGVGAETTREAQPALPVTAAEIGADAVETFLARYGSRQG